MFDSVNIDHAKTCDICTHVDKTRYPELAVYDAKTFYGSWANLCMKHFNNHTTGRLGTGFGQQLIYPASVVREFNDARNEKITEDNLMAAAELLVSEVLGGREIA